MQQPPQCAAFRLVATSARANAALATPAVVVVAVLGHRGRVRQTVTAVVVGAMLPRRDLVRRAVDAVAVIAVLGLPDVVRRAVAVLVLVVRHVVVRVPAGLVTRLSIG